MSLFGRVATVGVTLIVMAGVGGVTAPGAVAAPSTCFVNGTLVTGTQIQGTAGADEIACNNGVAVGTTVDGGAGVDTITIGVLMAGTVNGGAGSDSIVAAGFSSSAIVTGTINGGGLLGTLLDGDDLIVVANFDLAGAVLAGTVDGGAGNDSIDVTSGRGDLDGSFNSALVSGAAVRGGPGADTITILGGSLIGSGSFAAVEAGATVDGGGGLGTLLDGYNSIEINDRRSAEPLSYGNRGTILLGGADGRLRMRASENAGTIDGQAGKDAVWVRGQTASGETLGGLGDDDLYIWMGTGLMNGGPGTDRCRAATTIALMNCETA